MARQTAALLSKLSTRDLKRLLAARERIDELEKERDKLRTALDRVEHELRRLIEGALDGGKGASKRKPGRPRGSVNKGVRKQAGRKKATKKNATKKKVARQTTRQPAARKVTAKKAKSRKASGRIKLEDVILSLLKKRGGPMAYKELYAAVVEGKLFVSKSGNFDNVMRRTLSTSKLVKRVGRGIYGIA